MKLFENYSLKNLNTFHVDVRAKKFVNVENTDELSLVFEDIDLSAEKFLVLGGGSNILFTKDYDGTILHLSLRQLTEVNSDDEFTYIKSEAGMIWDDLVKFAVEKNLGGIENLAMIPGTVGAAPIQNIGAYGQEISESLFQVEYFDINERKIKSLTNEECKFGYRDSLFKNMPNKNFIITSVILKLRKNPLLELSYGNVASKLAESGIKNPTIKDVSNIIRKIRSEKLPDLQFIGNAGSFFKNPVVDQKTFQSIQEKFPDVPSFKQENKIKIPAAWLIEKSGLKGIRTGDVGTYPNQPLVIVNYGNASGEEILKFSEYIQEKVKSIFNIELTPEVNIF